MAFRLKGNESVRDGIRRVARRELEKARRTWRDRGKDEDERVHEVRKRLKKVRALLRLVRDGLGDGHYHRENERLRDTARPLTAVRDAKVLLEALEKLTDDDRRKLSRAALEAVRAQLVAERVAVGRALLDEEDLFVSTDRQLGRTIRKVGSWSLPRRGRTVLERGAGRVFDAADAAFRVADGEPTVEHLHEWRKQSKYLLHALELVETRARRIAGRLIAPLHELTQCLGEDHDLALLHEKVTAAAAIDDAAREKLLAEIRFRRKELEREALDLGRRIFGERPASFLRHQKKTHVRYREPALV